MITMHTNRTPAAVASITSVAARVVRAGSSGSPGGAKRVLVTALSVAAAVVSLTVSNEARAVERQHHIGLDPSLAILKIDDKSTLSVGGGLGVHYTYGLSDQFNLMVEGGSAIVALGEDEGGDIPPTRPSTVSYGTVGIGYVIDIIRWVPYIGLLVGGYALAGGSIQDPKILPGAELAAGLDYQLTRHWAVGVAVRQHLFVTKLDDYPSYTTAALRFEYAWGF